MPRHSSGRTSSWRSPSAESNGVQPRRIGGFQGGAGLTGFVGTGQGGFGGVGAGQGFGGFGGGGGIGGSGAGAGTGLAGGGEGLLSGYYGLVQREQAIRNTEASLAAQTNTLGLLEANFEAGLIDLIQVDEFRQNIETERAALLQSQVSFRNTIESYLVGNLGMPPWVPVHIDDSIIKPFQFVDPGLTAQQNYVTTISRQIGELGDTPDPASLEKVRLELLEVLQYSAEQLVGIDAAFHVFKERQLAMPAIQAPEGVREDERAELHNLEESLNELDRLIDEDLKALTDLKTPVPGKGKGRCLHTGGGRTPAIEPASGNGAHPGADSTRRRDRRGG